MDNFERTTDTHLRGPVLDAEHVASLGADLAACFTRSARDSRVVVVEGAGVQVLVRYGQLVVADGIGRHRRERHYSRPLAPRRLVIFATTGMVSLEAITWCEHAGVAIAVIDPVRCQVVLSNATASVHDARLLRQQALAADNGIGLAIAADLIEAKVDNQADLTERLLGLDERASTLRRLATSVRCCDDFDTLRLTEAQAAALYFEGWAGHPDTAMRFAARDEPRVPAHWLQPFTARRSPVTGGISNRLAATPLNALINFTAALAVSECSLAALAVGLTPNLGILHADRRGGRPSLSLDIIEPLRPHIETMVLNLVVTKTFRRLDFIEQRDGSVALGPSLRHQLVGTLPRWAELAGPVVESIAHRLADASGGRIPKPTSVTSRRRRSAAMMSSGLRRKTTRALPRRAMQPALPLPARCQGCGSDLDHPQRRWCSGCWPAQRALAGLAGSDVARQQLSDTASRQRKAQAVSAGKRDAWNTRLAELGYEQSDWDRIASRLPEVSLAAIIEATGLAYSSASAIRCGRRIPAPRHWSALAALVGLERGVSDRPGAPRPG